MKLVGATDWFIRWPFVLEGVIVGALGGLLAILLLVIAKIAVVDPLAKDFALIAAPDTIDFRLLIGILLALRDRRLRAGLRPQPAEVPPRLATRTATSSRRSPARAAARSTRAAIAAASSPAAARSSSSRPAEPVGVAGRARLGDAVGEQHERLARLELEVDVEQLRIVDPAEHRAGPADVLDRARAAHHHRHRVPGAADRRPHAAVELDPAHRDRAVAPAVCALGEQRAVDDVEHGARRGLVARRGAHACGGRGWSAPRRGRPCRSRRRSRGRGRPSRGSTS